MFFSKCLKRVFATNLITAIFPKTICDDNFLVGVQKHQQLYHIMFPYYLVCVGAADLTEEEGYGGVVVCFAVGDEVDLVLPLLLLQTLFGAAMVTHTAAAQDEDDRPHQPKP